jgi:hypothetical protein
VRRSGSRALAGAAAALVLAGACGRKPQAPAPDPSGGVTLTAPAPSSSTVASPLGAETTGYTNEMQAQNLREQAADLGISRLAKPSMPGGFENANEPQRTITYQEGIERTREMAAEAESTRHAIEGDKNKSVALPTPTPGVLSPNKEGSPIENSAGNP